MDAEWAWNVVLTLGVLMVGLGLASIIGSQSQDILEDTKSDFTVGTYAYNTTLAGQEAVDVVAQRQDTVGRIGVTGIIIGALFALLAGFFYKRGTSD